MWDETIRNSHPLRKNSTLAPKNFNWKILFCCSIFGRKFADFVYLTISPIFKGGINKQILETGLLACVSISIMIMSIKSTTRCFKFCLLKISIFISVHSIS